MEDDVQALLELTDRLYPDPVDQFEDLLAELLGVYRHSAMPYRVWRGVRMKTIEAAGSAADEIAPQVVAILEAT